MAAKTVITVKTFMTVNCHGGHGSFNVSQSRLGERSAVETTARRVLNKQHDSPVSWL